MNNNKNNENNENKNNVEKKEILNKDNINLEKKGNDELLKLIKESSELKEKTKNLLNKYMELIENLYKFKKNK